MKGTIIGTDLLQKDDSVQIIEINTNTTIFNDGAELLDYEPFFSVLVTNNITELHFIILPVVAIYQQMQVHLFLKKN